MDSSSFSFSCSCNREISHIYPVNNAKGYAKSQVNTTIFRKNSIVSHNGYQYLAFYDSTATVVLAKRKQEAGNWEIHRTQYQGNVRDAHNVVVIMVDGNGFLHMSWDHHVHPLRYARSIEPESLKMGSKEIMVGNLEDKVTYPEFYRQANGDLIFVYRDGSSGNGNLVMNHYDLKKRKWNRVQNNLIDGEGERNAYWQMFVDAKGVIHLSWVWRETGDVQTNHDLCYARSGDNGKTWENSKGEKYKMPINQESAEYIWRIPQGSNLINTTSMTTDDQGNPYIATYYQAPEDSCTQFHVFYHQGGEWKKSTASKRSLNFVLGGFGTRSVPVSRPKIVFERRGEAGWLHLIYRDEELGNKVCLSSAKLKDNMDWEVSTLTDQSLERWEPSYDTELWRTDQKLQLFLQKTGQGSGEKIVEMPAQAVGVLEVDLKR